MTIICYRDGILAADSAIWQGDVIVGHREKIRRLQDGRLFAAAGASPLIQAVGDWLEGSAPAPRIPEAEEWDILGIILGEAGPMLIDRTLNAYPMPGNFVAIGRGESFAMGALACGAGAEEAVKLCIEKTAFCAGTVQIESLPPNHGPLI